MNKILNRAEQEQQLEQEKNREAKKAKLTEKEDKNVYSDLVQALRVKK